MSDNRQPGAGIRRVTPAMRWILVAAAFFVLVAGMQTFVLAERTERYFAWTIRFPLTAAFLGAGYWASGVLEFLSARQREWARARPGVPAVWLFTTLTLIASLIHYDVFRTESFWAWAWFNVYAIVPVALGIIWIVQVRRPGGDPPPSSRLPTAFRIACAVHVVLMLPLGVALFIAPGWADGAWPWPLTPLTGRAIGAWLIGWSVVLLGVLRENDRARTFVPALSYGIWGVLSLVAITRYADALQWSMGRVWVAAVFAASVVVVGGAGVIQARARREHDAVRSATVGGR